MTKHESVERVLFTEKDIALRIKELGSAITKHYSDVGGEILVVGILRGSVVFFADLIRAIDLPVQIDFMAVSSYGSSSKSSGVVRIIKDLEESIEGKHILVVEDIVDTGLTLDYLKSNILSRGALSFKIASLLDKPDRRRTEIKPDFLGFTIPDEFVIGFGLDYAQDFRNLPYIAVLKKEYYEK